MYEIIQKLVEEICLPYMSQQQRARLVWMLKQEIEASYLVVPLSHSLALSFLMDLTGNDMRRP